MRLFGWCQLQREIQTLIMRQFQSKTFGNFFKINFSLSSLNNSLITAKI